MQIKQVQLNNFRNYHSLSLSFTPGVHIFWGSNAQGKTNLLEAIFIAVLGKSFRANHDDELIRWDANEGSICVNFANKIIKNVTLLIANHLNNSKNSNKRYCKKLIDKIGHENMPKLFKLMEADRVAHKPPFDFTALDKLKIAYHEICNNNEPVFL